MSLFSQDDSALLVARIRNGTVNGVRGQDGRHVLAVFTDGGNSTGSIRYQDLINLARASQVTIYVVGLLEHQPGSARRQLQLPMRRIANETGGRASIRGR